MKLFKNMKDPSVNRFVGYVIMFSCIPFFGIGSINEHDAGGVITGVCYIFGSLLFILSVVWMAVKVRCPHCGKLLSLKFYNISRCKYCGKSTNPNVRD